MNKQVELIKKWISNEMDGLMDADGNFEYSEHEGAFNVLCYLDAYIDSLQEELISTHDAVVEIPFGAKDSELIEASYHIPEGFHAEIIGNEVVIKEGEAPKSKSF